MINKKLRNYSLFYLLLLFVFTQFNGIIMSAKTAIQEGEMFFLSAIETVDITKEIPPVYLAAFGLIMIVVLFIANKGLTAMFIPKDGREEAPVWSFYSGKSKRK